MFDLVKCNVINSKLIIVINKIVNLELITGRKV